MNNLPVKFLVVLPLLSLFSCSSLGRKTIRDNGDLITQNRTVDKPYHSFENHSSFDIVLDDALPADEIELQGPSNILESTETTVIHGKLTVRSKTNRSLVINHPVTVALNPKSLNEIDTKGSGDLTSKQALKKEGLRLKSSGSGDTALKLIAKTLKINATGSGNFTLTGKTDELTIAKSGSGDIDAHRLSAERVQLKTSGSGNIRLHANKRIEGNATGSGDIYWSGKAQPHIAISGSGEVRQNRKDFK